MASPRHILLALLFAILAMPAHAEPTTSHDPDIDRARQEVRATPTTAETYRERSWGVVDEHRKIRPAYHTIRKLHSPVEILKVDGTTATVKTRPLGHLPSYTLKGYKLVWEKGERKGEIPLPTLKPGDPAWTGDLPVPGAALKLVTPLGYDIDDTIDRSSSSDGVENPPAGSDPNSTQ